LAESTDWSGWEAFEVVLVSQTSPEVHGNFILSTQDTPNKNAIPIWRRDPMSLLSRRSFLIGATGVFGAAAGLYFFRDRLATGWPASPGYGPLQPTKDENTGLELIALPKGFRYTTFGWTHDPLTDGSRTPSSHDGMAAVRQEGTRVTLIRNHERSGRSKAFGPETERFDSQGAGGCVTLVFDTARERLLEARASLVGTYNNCAGGPTPWGTWLSCEEAVVGPQSVDKKDQKPLGLKEDHGWVFEVPAEGLAKPLPIKEMGRFVHEAVCVDPVSGVVYLTEDSNPAGLYRFTPAKPGQLHKGGTLEMLRSDKMPDLRKGIPPHAELSVRWVPIEDPTRGDSPGTSDGKGVYKQGAEQGGSAFARLEGIFFHAGRVYLNSTSGGDADQGQVWEYTPGEEKLRLVFESPSIEVLNMPDNLCVSPNGCLVLCEDGDRVGQRLQGLTTDGRIFPFAENIMQLQGEKNGFQGDLRGTEWAGVCFSPDGKWLFANLQTPGFTLAITGPWNKGPL
jgi:secreted PhoX family phosphatase